MTLTPFSLWKRGFRALNALHFMPERPEDGLANGAFCAHPTHAECVIALMAPFAGPRRVSSFGSGSVQRASQRMPWGRRPIPVVDSSCRWSDGASG